MVHSLLISRRPQVVAAILAAVSLAIIGGCLFQDPLEELDPATLDDASFDTLAPTETFQVARKHILESFGAYGCSNCPEAEGQLEPYYNASVTSPHYNPSLVVLNYHVAFPSTVVDPWITAGTQARHDGFGFTGLPQVKLNGANAPYGIREKDVRYFQGEYDSLLRRFNRVDSLTSLDVRIDSSYYDSTTQRLVVRVTVLNRSASPRGALTLRLAAVKNQPAVLPTLPNHPWEVIVAETTERDSSGEAMTLVGMAGLRSKTWVVSMAVPLESTRTPLPSTFENPADYAVVAFVRDIKGVVQNVATRGYAPH